MKRSLSRVLGVLVFLAPLAALTSCDSGDSDQQGGNRDSALTSCTPAARDCASPTVARLCPADGSAWMAYGCAAGETCADGACQSPAPCNAGESTCATSGIRRVCASDGLSFFPVACGGGEQCVEGQCVLDAAGAPCTPGSAFCTDAATSLRCQGDGTGYDVTTCPKGTGCADGHCAGKVCRLGESRCNAEGQRLDCAAGSAWELSACGKGETCVARSSGGLATAACEKASCSLGTQTCGKPKDPGADPTRSFSRCEQLLDGSIDWVSYSCAAPTTCNGSGKCEVECTPGAERCSADSTGTQVCDAKGRWSTVTPCVAASEAAQTCRMVPASDGSGVIGALCMDPACAWLNAEYPRAAYPGLCEGTGVRLCGADGKLASTVQLCPSGGVCQVLGDTRLGGHEPGACTWRCTQGERRCVDGTSLYHSCDESQWSLATTRCEDGAQCFGFAQDGKQDIRCGAECLPGSRRCDAGGGIRTCGDDWRWAATEPCKLGSCRETLGTAVCSADCIPGARDCDDSMFIRASDGLSIGGRSVRTCTAAGLWDSGLTVCAGTSTCRVSRTGATLGCVECVAAEDGGNSMGLADTRCDLRSGGLQTCQAGHLWGVATPCGQGEVCTAEFERETCASCSRDGMPCTESYLASLGYREGCSVYELGEPQSCGGQGDCCGRLCADAGTPTVARCE